MTPEQKIKWAMLVFGQVALPEPVTPEGIDRAWTEVVAAHDHWDLMSEMRSGDLETGLPTGPTYNYAGKSVAAKMPDGTWVGWTYWHGGGKHSNPSQIPWMEEAYSLAVHEETRVVKVWTRD